MSGTGPGFELSRRAVMKTVGVSGVGLDVDSSGRTASSSRGPESTDASNCRDYGVAECHDLGGWVFGHKNYGNVDVFDATDDHVGTLHGKSFVTVDYLDVTWEEFGNPVVDGDSEGCWRHTFVLSALAVSDMEPHEENADAYLSDSLYSSGHFEVTTTDNHEEIAVSARRDRDLAAFMEPDTLVEQLESERGADFRETLSVVPNAEWFKQEPHGNILRRGAAAAGRQKEESESDFSWGPVKASLLFGMENVSEIDALKFVGSGLGTIDDILTWAEIIGMFSSVDPDSILPVNRGFRHEFEYSGDRTDVARAFGSYLLFDVYVPPSSDSTGGSVVVEVGYEYDSPELDGIVRPDWEHVGFREHEFSPSKDPATPGHTNPVRVEIEVPSRPEHLKDGFTPPDTLFAADAVPPASGNATNVGYDAYEGHRWVDFDFDTKVFEKGEPTVAFDVDPSPVLPGETVTFDGSESFDPEPDPVAGIEGYDWAYKPGDERWGSDAVESIPGGETVETSFDEAGLFDVRLTVTDREGLENSTTERLPVDTPPVPVLDVDPSAPVRDYETTLSGGDSYDPDEDPQFGTIEAYEWTIYEFGDSLDEAETYEGSEVDYVFKNAGEYRVVLKVSDGLVSESEHRDVTVQEPEPPTAHVSPETGEADPGEPVSFDATQSADPDGGDLVYDWSVPDAATLESGLQDPDYHQYSFSLPTDTFEETYTVSVTVTDETGLSDTAETEVTVASAGEPPGAKVSAGQNSLDPGEAVTFDARASFDPNGDLDGFEHFSWDDPDEATLESGLDTPPGYRRYSFSLPDGVSRESYTVSVTVTDDEGLSDQATATVTVSEEQPEPPDASLTASRSSAEPGDWVAFDAVGSSDPDGSLDGPGHYSWDAPPEATLESGLDDWDYRNYSFSLPAGVSRETYTVSVTVTDDDGLSDTASESVTVSAASGEPTASLSAGESTADDGEAVTFDAMGSSDPTGQSLSFDWDLPSAATLETPLSQLEPDYRRYSFSLPAGTSRETYTVSVTVTDEDGLTDSTSVRVTVVE